LSYASDEHKTKTTTQVILDCFVGSIDHGNCYYIGVVDLVATLLDEPIADFALVFQSQIHLGLC